MKSKKIISLFLSVLLMLSLSVPAMAEFNDTDGYWGKHEISVVANAGIVNGYGDGSFRPNQNISRQEFAKVIAVFMGYTVQGDISGFTDVDPSGFFAPYLAMCVEAGVLKGDGSGLMRPTDYVTREEASAMLCRALGLKTDGAVLNFTDNGNVFTWFRGEVAALARTGLIVGYPDGSFMPKNNLTRGEMMVVISRLLVDADGNFATMQLINNNGSETVTVNAISFNDYSLNVNIPDKKISIDKFTLKAKVEEIPGMDATESALITSIIGNMLAVEEEIVTGAQGLYQIKDYAYNAFRFNFGTIHVDVNGLTSIYNIYSMPKTDGSVDVLATPTSKDAAAAAFAPIMDLDNIGISFSKGNSVTLANGSYLQIGTEKLCFKSDYKGDLTLDLSASEDELKSASSAALTVTKGNTSDDQVTLFIKAGTAIATEKGTFTLKKNITVTLNGIIGEYDGILSRLESGDFSFLYNAVELFNGLLDSYDGTVLYLDVRIA